MLQNEMQRNGYAPTFGYLTQNGLVKIIDASDDHDTIKIPTKNRTFYDLGSGKGHVIRHAIDNYPLLQQAIGIELDTEKHNEAIENLKGITKCSLVNKDIFDPDVKIREDGIIYISNLCFSDSINGRLKEKIEASLLPGKDMYVFCSKPLNFQNKYIKKYKKITCEQSWSPSSDIHKYKLRKGRQMKPVKTGKKKKKRRRQTQKNRNK